MKFSNQGPSERFKLYFFILILVAVAIFATALFTNILQTPDEKQIPPILWLLAAGLFLVIVIMLLAKTMEIIELLRSNAVKFEKIAEALEKNRTVLNRISDDTRLSDSAKTIASREINIRTLREIVFEKMQQQEFETASEIIDEIAQKPEFKNLAARLRQQAEKYKHSTDLQRVEHVIGHVEKLLDNYEWANASVAIERLINTYPDSEDAKKLRGKLVEKKEERKKQLLTLWDDAVRREATDRSIEILRELDMYLTPNEGLALQEAAKDVFKNKLHNLGVRFSIAVSGNKWKDALNIGNQIISNFPNSRMAQEIRGKIDVLRENAALKNSG